MDKESIVSKLMSNGVLATPDLVNDIFLGKKDINLVIKKDRVVKVLWSYNKPPKKRTYDDFVQYFRSRLKSLSNILRQRRELNNLTSASRARSRNQEKISIIGIISEKIKTKNNNYILKLEDFSGEVSVIIHQNKPEAFNLAEDLVLDEVIGVVGVVSNDVIFANNIIFPDIPQKTNIKSSPEEEYVVFVGDPQVGSKEFLLKEFTTMLKWISGGFGSNEQKLIASKIGYVVFVGDLVEGVGVYPGQEDDLLIKDVKKQYDEFARLISKIPNHIKIILCPGNHDAGRIADPQPPLYRDFASKLYDMNNVTIISSPGLVNIGSSSSFSGFDILIYHGYSIPWIADNVPSIRTSGGQKATDKVMKFMLQRRHLAPTHGSNLYIPDSEEDPMIINKVPDIFATGHIHRVVVSNYKGVFLVNPGCWTDITEDQIKRGLEPQPGRLVLFNMKSRNFKILNFYGDTDD